MKRIVSRWLKTTIYRAFGQAFYGRKTQHLQICVRRTLGRRPLRQAFSTPGHAGHTGSAGHIRNSRLLAICLLICILLSGIGCGRKKEPPVEVTGKVPQLYPTALNVNGIMIGSVKFPDLYPSFRIENGKQSELALPSDAAWGYPLGINNVGRSVGYAGRRDNQSRHAVVWQNGRPNWLDDGNALSSEASAINNGGVIVGFRIADDGIAHPVQWRNGTMQELAAPAFVSWRPAGINTNGDIVGCGIDAQQRPHLYLWRQNRLSEFGTGYHIAINNRGLIAGDYQTPDRRLQACVWNGTTRKDLPTLPQTNESRALACNDRGQIVGSADLRDASVGAYGSPLPVLWQNGHALNLNTVRPPSANYTLEEAVAINNSGQILCTARRGKWSRAALLTPGSNGWQIQVY